MKNVKKVLLGFVILFTGVQMISAAEFTVQIDPGLNLISVPLKDPVVIAEETDCRDYQLRYFGGFLQLVESCDGYDYCKTDGGGRSWRVIKLKDLINGTDQLDGGIGYFVDLSSTKPCKIKFSGDEFKIGEDNPYTVTPVYENYAVIGAPYIPGVTDNIKDVAGTSFESIKGECEGLISMPYKLKRGVIESSTEFVKVAYLKPGSGYIVKVKESCDLGGYPESGIQECPGNSSRLNILPSYITRVRSGYIDKMTVLYTLTGLKASEEVHIKCGFRDVDGTAKITDLGEIEADSEGIINEKLTFPDDFDGAEQGKFVGDKVYFIGCYVEQSGRACNVQISPLIVGGHMDCHEKIENATAWMEGFGEVYYVNESIDLAYVVGDIPETIPETAAIPVRCVSFNSKGREVASGATRMSIENCSDLGYPEVNGKCAKYSMHVDKGKASHAGVYMVGCFIPYIGTLERGLCHPVTAGIAVAEKTGDSVPPEITDSGSTTDKIKVTVRDGSSAIMSGIQKLPVTEVKSYALISFESPGAEDICKAPMDCTGNCYLADGSCTCTYGISTVASEGNYTVTFRVSAIDRSGNIGNLKLLLNFEDEYPVCS